MKKIFVSIMVFGTFLLTSSLGMAAYMHPRKALEKLSSHAKQIWVVGYTNGTLDEAISDLEISFANGADAIVFEGHDYKKLDSYLGEIRKRFPKHVIGVNFLGGDDNLNTYKETFELAKKHHCQIAWTDFSGIDLIKEAPEISLHSVMAAKPADVFYVSGIHMKYSTPVDPNKTIEQSAIQAMGWVDGIVITGPKTGVATDPDRARDARSVIGNYPMGAASGVSAENVHTILPYIDYALVNTSISDKNHRIIGEKLKALRAAMDVKVEKL
jgi:predicted TIM-barrel enzyme